MSVDERLVEAVSGKKDSLQGSVDSSYAYDELGEAGLCLRVL